ncbi:MAG: membrane protein [Rhodobacterales bacterium]|nr:MAG: membrane protein [Rhodobacterales bacterium]
MNLKSTPESHSVFEDSFALATACVLMTLSVGMLKSAGLFTGQLAGAALVLSYWTGLSFGTLFFVTNLPFYTFALLQMGWKFTLKTFIAVSIVSLCVDLSASLITYDFANPALAAIAGGATAAVGLLVLFRHGMTLGGIGITGLYLQDRFGIKAGHVQLGFDAVVFGFAVFLFPPSVVAYSFLGAIIVNVLIAINHRRDRYVAR